MFAMVAILDSAAGTIPIAGVKIPTISRQYFGITHNNLGSERGHIKRAQIIMTDQFFTSFTNTAIGSILLESVATLRHHAHLGPFFNLSSQLKQLLEQQCF